MTLFDSVRSVFGPAAISKADAQNPRPRSSMDEIIRWLQTGHGTNSHRATDPPRNSKRDCCPDDIQ